MFTQDVRVHYLGFHPSDKTDQTLRDWAEELRDEAPRAANVKAVYSRQGRSYQSEVRVTSKAGHFHAVVRGPNLYMVSREAHRRIRRQLSKWKTRRLHHRENHQTMLTMLKGLEVEAS